MRSRIFAAFPTDQRGVALPMAMLGLLILSALVIAFSVLSASEPTIANNQRMVAQARALAEAGVERAIWALDKPSDPKGIPIPLVTAPAPYDGSQLVTVSAGGTGIGGFRVTVTNAAGGSERNIIAVGWVPNDTTAGPKAHQKITVTLVGSGLRFLDPPGALSVRGELQASGNSTIDGRTDQSCGKKIGVLTTDAYFPGGSVDIKGAADNNLIDNEISDANFGPMPALPHDTVKNISTTVFDQFIYSDNDINTMRAYAKAHNTYYQGTVSFKSSNKMPNGLIFVDTVSGNNITPSTPESDYAALTIEGNPFADPSGIFSGWIFANGKIRIDGNMEIHGLVYAQNDFIYHGTGTGKIVGAVISRNILDLVASSVDSDINGNAKIIYNCSYAKGAGVIPLTQTFTIKPGTYKEVSGS